MMRLIVAGWAVMLVVPLTMALLMVLTMVLVMVVATVVLSSLRYRHHEKDDNTAKAT